MWVSTVLVGSAFADPAPAVRVVISGVRDTQGRIRCQLFDAAPGFPETGATAQTTSAIQSTASGRTASCAFEGLAPGTYAVAVLHDADDDGRMAKNVFGVPLEGYGVSNDRTHALSAPRWDECRFELGPAEDRTLAIPLHY